MKNLAAIVLAYRQAEGLSLRRIAASAQVDPVSLLRFLNLGTYGPTCEKLLSWVCESLGVFLRKYRLLTDQTEVAVAQRIGIKPSDYELLEGGAPLPQSVFAKVVRWMMEG